MKAVRYVFQSISTVTEKQTAHLQVMKLTVAVKTGACFHAGLRVIFLIYASIRSGGLEAKEHVKK